MPNGQELRQLVEFFSENKFLPHFSLFFAMNFASGFKRNRAAEVNCSDLHNGCVTGSPLSRPNCAWANNFQRARSPEAAFGVTRDLSSGGQELSESTISAVEGGARGGTGRRPGHKGEFFAATCRG